MLFKKKKIEGKLFHKVDTLKDDEMLNNLGARLKRTNCIEDYKIRRKGVLYKLIPKFFSPKYDLWVYNIKLDRYALRNEIQCLKDFVFKKRK